MIPFLSRTRAPFCRVLLASFLSLAALFPLQAGESLLKNGALSLDESAKAVASWKLSPPETAIEPVKDELPEGVSSALAVTIGPQMDNNNDGQISQRLSVPESTESFTLSGWIRSDKPGSGYLQIKLFKGKEELKRIKAEPSSDIEWKQVVKEFPTEGADRIEIICRWSRNSRHEGVRVYFADLKLN